MRILSSAIGILREWLRFAVLTLLILFLVRGFLLEAYTIPTSSMEGTLLVGDYLIVNKALYGAQIPLTHGHLPGFRGPGRGDLVVFRPPHDRLRVYVKRVVGVPGDTLSMWRKALFLNGVRQDEPYARYLDYRGDAVHPGMAWQSSFLAAAGPEGKYEPSRDNWGPLVVPPDQFFVLGDNRDNSEDSRYWGFISREDIKGRPWMVYLSLKNEAKASGGWFSRVRWDRVGQILE